MCYCISIKLLFNLNWIHDFHVYVGCSNMWLQFEVGQSRAGPWCFVACSGLVGLVGDAWVLDMAISSLLWLVGGGWG